MGDEQDILSNGTEGQKGQTEPAATTGRKQTQESSFLLIWGKILLKEAKRTPFTLTHAVFTVS